MKKGSPIGIPERNDYLFTMKSLILGLSVLLILLSWSTSDACNGTDALFKIARSKNGNVVQYDACLLSDGGLSNSDPVSVYWILENGQREALTSIEKNYAYGVKLGKKIGKDKVEIFIAALADREVIVEKKDGKYKVVVSINGNESILENIFVESEDRWFGPPKVLYIDVFGRTLAANTSVKERIVPKG